MHRIILTTLICLFLLLNHSLLAGKTKQPETTLPQSPTLSEGIKAKTGTAKIPTRPDLSRTKADLIIRSFSCSPPAVKQGETTTLRAVVANTGKDKAANFDVAFYQKGKLIGKKQKLSIAPGQSIQVVSTYRPEQSGQLTIQVQADSGNTVAETNKNNNTGDAILTVSKSIPTKQRETPSPSLSKKLPSPAITTRPAGRINQENKKKPPVPADLALEQINYHDDSASLSSKTLSSSKSGISCVIRNSGTVQLDPQQFRQSRVDITIDRKPLPGYFRLEQLVPYNKIAKPGSHATAWIPLELREKTAISITINSNGAISETNMTNNSSSGVLGGTAVRPTIAAKTVLQGKGSADQHKLSTGTSLKKPDNERPRPTKPGTPGSNRLGNLQMTMERPAEAAPRPIGEVAPKLLDHGIEIISPNFEDVYSPSSMIPIRYRFSRTVEPGGAVVFTMVGGGDEVATLHIRNDSPPGPTDPYRQVELQLPGGIGAGSYLIGARHEASGAAGLSDMFRVISLNAEEIEGSAEEIGDGGGFGGDGTAILPYFEPLQAYSVKDDDSIGDGGGFGGPGVPTLVFVNDLSEVHINSRDYGRNAAPLEWIYYGPLDAAPDRWRLELLEPSSSVVVETDNLTCNDAVDTPASTSQALPSRRCSSLFSCRDRNGSYHLRLSGAGLSTESGPVHCGIDELRPHFTWFNVSPTAVIQGEPISYGFTYSPPESELIVQLLRDDEPEYTRMVPRQVDDDGYATYEGRIETSSLPIGSSNYRLEVRNRYSGVGLSSDPISILEPPFAETDDNAVDFRLTGLRVSNEGQLQVNTAITAAAAGVRVLSYRLAYMVGKDDISYRRVERDVPASGGWISLGHIHTFTTVDERRTADLLGLRVLVNQPVEIVERTYDNNSISRQVWIRGSYAYCRLSNAPGETYYGDGVLRYEIDPQWPSDTLTGLDLVCYNRGFEDVTGTIEVIQYRDVPGELRSETVSLGNTTHFEPTTEDYRMEGTIRRLALFSDSGGISFPRPGNGELRIILRGPLYFHSDRQEQTIEFRRR
jgi:hypothetical protein